MIVSEIFPIKSSSKYSSILNFFIVSLLASFLIGAFGKVRIFLPFTPVPIILHMQLIYLLAFLLGPKKAATATFLFIIQAIIGLPVLPSLQFFTICKGYYIGYFFSAIVIGILVQYQKTYSRAFLATLFGNVIVYICGFTVFSVYAGVKVGFFLGVVPFIIPDIFKNMVVIQILKLNSWAK